MLPLTFFFVVAMATAAKCETDFSNLRYFIIAPPEFRVNTNESIWVAIENTPDAVDVVLTLHQTSREKIMEKKIRILQRDSNRVVKMQVRYGDLANNDFRKNVFVNLTISVREISQDSNELVREQKQIRVIPQQHKLLIQTNKKVYRPGDTVKMRVLCLDGFGKLSRETMNIVVRNPNGVITHYFPNMTSNDTTRFPSRSFKLSPIPMYGTWKIVAKFGNPVVQRQIEEIEVEQYRLPKFHIDVQVDPSVILPFTKAISIKVNAFHHYGEPVLGRVRVILGVWYSCDEDTKDQKLFLFRNNYTSLPLISGKYEYAVSMAELRNGSTGGNCFCEGSRLFVRAHVRENASGIHESREVSSVVYAQKPFMINLVGVGDAFVPHIPYVIRASVRSMVQKVTPTHLCLQASAFDCANRSDPYIEITSGRVVEANQFVSFLLTPKHCRELLVIVRTCLNVYDRLAANASYRGNQQAESTLRVPKALYHIQEYLIMNATSGLVKAGDTVGLQFHSNHEGDVMLYLLVKHKSGRVKTWNENFNLKQIYLLKTDERMVPLITVTAFYFSGSHLIGDSFDLPVRTSCKEQFKINFLSNSYRPNKRLEFELFGPRGTFVGLLVTDWSLYAYNAKKTNKVDLRGDINGKCTTLRHHIFSNRHLGSFSNTSYCINDLERLTEKSKHRREALNLCKEEISQCWSKVVGQLRLEQNATVEDFIKLMKDHERRMTNVCRNISKLVNALNRAGTGKVDIEKFKNCCKGKTGRLGDTEVGYIYKFRETRQNYGDTRWFFPEAWLFYEVQLYKGLATIEYDRIPDTITKWAITGLAYNDQFGVCPLGPYNFTAFKDLFVDVHLPVQVQQREQVEVLVNIYNYKDVDVKVQLELDFSDICTMNSKARLLVPSKKSKVYSMPIASMETGEFWIFAKATSRYGSDAMNKSFTVVPPGMQRATYLSRMIDAHENAKRSIVSNVVEVDLTIHEQFVSGSEKAWLIVSSDVYSPLHTQRVTSLDMDTLLNMPVGCGEQTLLFISPLVYTLSYLRETGQLQKMPSFKRKAIEKLRSGYERATNFNLPNGSFAAWFTGTTGSTWLTAMAMKSFCEAGNFIDIDHQIIDKAISFIATQQKPAGYFVDPWRYGHYFIQRLDTNASMTSFVLIALQECHKSTSLTSTVKARLDKAVTQGLEFLKDGKYRVQNTYEQSMINYAFALSREKWTRYSRRSPLVERIINNTERGSEFGNGRYTAKDVEIVAYSLLSSTRLKKYNESKSLAHWLIQQRNSKGAFFSTKDTTIALQALGEYGSELRLINNPVLNLTVTSKNGQYTKEIRLNSRNRVSRYVNVPVNEQLMIAYEGIGLAQMHFETVYNVPTESLSHQKCNYSINVTTQGIDPDDFETDDGTGTITYTREWYQDKGSYSRLIPIREKPVAVRYPRGTGLTRAKPPVRVSKHNMNITVCVRDITGRASGMSIIEVGLFSGYTCIAERLKSQDKIRQHEITERSVILYLDEIRSDESTCVSVEIQKQISIGNIQPVGVKVYNYYEPDQYCTVFYHPQAGRPKLSYFCWENDQCFCMEGRCAKCYDPNAWQRYFELEAMACASDFVLKVRIERFIGTIDTGFNTFSAKVLHKWSPSGSGFNRNVSEIGRSVFLKQHGNCYCPKDLNVHEQYLIIGNFTTGDLTTEFSPRYNRKVPIIVLSDAKTILNWPRSPHTRKQREMNGWLDRLQKNIYCKAKR